MDFPIRPSEIEVPDDDPFRDDILGRKELEPPLTQFILQARAPFVLAIDGPWGSGKTTFIRMWQKKLEQAGCKCLYFNAWETDFAADPLVALVGELSASLDDAARREKVKKLRQSAAGVLKSALPVLVRLATQGVVNLPENTEKELAALAGEVAERQLKEYGEAKTSLKEFREALEELVLEVSGAGEATGEPDADPFQRKVVVLVDELDRCRPTYAIELLERVKHLFSVDGVVFVLGIARRQLVDAIGTLYGRDCDAEGYLRRFIDIDYDLPAPLPGAYCRELLRRYQVRQALSGRRSSYSFENLECVLESMASAVSLSLREQWQLVVRMRVVLQTIPPRDYAFEVALAVLLTVRLRWPDRFAKLQSEQMTGDELEDLISLLVPRREEEGRLLIESTLLLPAVMEKVSLERWEKYEKEADAQNLDYAYRVVSETREGRQYRVFPKTMERIRLTQPFVTDGPS